MKIIAVKKLKKNLSTPRSSRNFFRNRRREVYGIIGKSGSGKSTLVNCLTTLEKPTSGEIEVAGVNLATLHGAQLRAFRKNIGMVFQHFNLLSSRTALENVLYPLELDQPDPARAKELLRLVGLEGKENLYPAQLSGGQKQRVAIARALANHPKVLFCDEPTSALDPETTHEILQLLAELNKKLKLTIVIITHEMDVIKQICTRVAVLDQGQIVEQGSVTDLFSKPQHTTTKRFLQNIVHEMPDFPAEENKELLRLCFTEGLAEKPIISQLLRKFDVEINILLGGIDTLQSGSVGNLIVALSGQPDVRKQVHQFLEIQGVCFEQL